MAAVALQRLSATAPDLVERLYSRGAFPAVARVLAHTLGAFPFSIAEVTVWLASLLLVVWLVAAAAAVWRAPRADRLTVVWRRVAVLLAIIVVAYVGFVFLWGLNYDRQTYAQTAGLKVAPASPEELAALGRSLIERANDLRAQVAEDSSGVAKPAGDPADIFRRAQLGYDRAALVNPALAGHYSRPKAVISSALWSYTGTAGMYWPFTGEANVNVAAPAFTIPASAAHEMAHQRGFAREDEANYIAYLTCRLHPDVDFQYSGVVMALVEVMNALRQASPDLFKQLVPLYGPGLKRDLIRQSDFWAKYEGPVSKYTDRVNDQYLKANGQTAGIESYGRMVDLLLAEYRAGQGQ